MNISRDGMITLGGREFKRTKNGVDESQVGAYIDELIKERDELSSAKHHVTSLTKLAENTIVEADRLANQIKSEAAEQAKAESEAILTEAREQAARLAEERQAEILEAAKQEAETVRSEAKKQARALVEDHQARVRNELCSAVSGSFGHLLQELENLKQQATSAQAEFESRISEFVPESQHVTGETGEEGGTAPAEARQEGGTATEGEAEGDGMIARREEEGEAARMEEEGTEDETPEPVKSLDFTETSFDLSKLFQNDERAELGEPQFEVEILPPVDMAKIMEVVAYLDELPEVENTEIIPRMDTPSILVFLREEINFIDVLSESPAVAHVEEVTTDADSSNGEAARGPRRVRIGLSGIMSHESPDTK